MSIVFQKNRHLQKNQVVAIFLEKSFLKFFKKEVVKMMKESSRSPRYKEKLEGTTIVAIKYNGGVIMAADKRVSAGHRILADNFEKIKEVGALACLGGAGLVSSLQLLQEKIKDDIVPAFENMLKTDIFVDGIANLIKEVMRGFAEKGNWLETWPILAGWDPYTEEGRIFLFEEDGCMYENYDYGSSGSGEDHALNILRTKWSKNCSREQAIEIAVEAILRASQNDSGTSKPLLSPPIIKDINPEEIVDISEQVAFKIAWGKFFKEQAQRGEEGLEKFIFSDLKKEKKEKNKKVKKDKKDKK